MMNSTENIFVYKTNIQNQYDQDQIKNVFGSKKSVNKWSIDTEDIDCVLRVISDRITSQEIVETIHEMGYQCTELI